jgi:hypothetical protein
MTLAKVSSSSERRGARALAAGSGAPTRDIGTPDLYYGTWGQGLLTDWWETTADLIWPQSVITYGRMRHDPQLRGIVSAYILPIIRAAWLVDPAGCRDEVAQFVATDLGIPVLGAEEDAIDQAARVRGVRWRKHIASAAYNHLVYGHMPYELRYRIDEPQPGGVHLDHLGERMPWTLAQIHLGQDGLIQEVVQTTQQQPIPANRLIWYVHDREGSNWAGISLLRACFGLWLLKHETMRVHASAIRRFGMGVPEVTAPPGASQLQVQSASDLASAYRAGDQSGIGLPAGFQFNLRGMQGSVPDGLAFLKWIDQAMAKMALAGLVELGHTDNGSRALGETFMDLFLLALQSVADDLADTATTGQEGMPGVAADLVLQNWGEDEPVPKIMCADVGENYEATAESLAKLTQFGALSPDPALDGWIRERWRLPDREIAWEPTSRGIPAPGEPAGPVETIPGEPEISGLPETAPLPQSTAAGRGGTRARRRPGAPRRAAAAAPALLSPLPRRQPNKWEIAAGFDAAGHQRAWVDALASLVAAYRPVLASQRHSLVDQIIAAISKGQTGKLGALKVTDLGQDVVAQALGPACQAAITAISREAQGQGVTVPPDRVKFPQAKLTRIAQARTGLIGAWQATQAGTHALQMVTAAGPADASRAGSATDQFLAGLSDRTLWDQLGAALTAAQNAGRMSFLDAAPEAAGTAMYVASEINDQNECTPCSDIDGTTFDSVQAAGDAYPNGGYLYCEGGMRCRGTVIAIWGGEPNLG